MRRALEALPGVRRVEVDFYKKQAVVTVEEAAYDEQKLIQALAEAGFGASVQEEAKRLAASSVAEAEQPTADVAIEQAAPAPTGAAYSPPIFGEHAPITVHLDRSVLRPGDLFRAAVVFDIDQGWHIYGNPLGPGIGLPTVISAKAPDGFHFDPTRYAPAHRMEQDFGEAGKTWVSQHTGKTIHYLSGKVGENVESGRYEWTIEVTAQLCDPTRCIRSKAIIPLPVTVAPKGTLSESINDELFTGFEAAKVPRSEDSLTR